MTSKYMAVVLTLLFIIVFLVVAYVAGATSDSGLASQFNCTSVVTAYNGANYSANYTQCQLKPDLVTVQNVTNITVVNVTTTTVNATDLLSVLNQTQLVSLLNSSQSCGQQVALLNASLLVCQAYNGTVSYPQVLQGQQSQQALSAEQQALRNLTSFYSCNTLSDPLSIGTCIQRIEDNLSSRANWYFTAGAGIVGIVMYIITQRNILGRKSGIDKTSSEIPVNVDAQKRYEQQAGIIAEQDRKHQVEKAEWKRKMRELEHRKRKKGR